MLSREIGLNMELTVTDVPDFSTLWIFKSNSKKLGTEGVEVVLKSNVKSTKKKKIIGVGPQM